MNVLINLIALLGRYLYILVAVAVLGVMPYCGQLAWNANQEYRMAQERLTVAKNVRAAQDQQVEKINEYKKFSGDVQDFLKAVRENRLEESNWTTYDVDIKSRLSTVTELRTLLSNAGPTNRYYFKPKRLEITSLFAKESLPPDYKKLLYGMDDNKDKNALQKILKSLGTDEKPPVPGEKVLLSLSGTYLVFPRS